MRYETITAISRAFPGKRFSLKVLAVGLFVLCGIPFLANALTCGQEVLFYDNSRELRFDSAPNEVPNTSFFMIGGDRFVVGMNTTERNASHPELRFKVIKGRLVVQQIDEAQTLVSVHPPSMGGKPPHIGELHISPDGKYIAAIGATVYGGPVLMYETGAVELLHTTGEVKNSWDNVVYAFVELFSLASKGHPQAIEALKQVDPQGIGMSHWKADPQAARNRLKDVAPAQTGIPNQSEEVAVRGVQFHPSSQSYLANAGYHASIRDSRTGNEIQQIFLYSKFAPPQKYFSSTYFVDRGNVVAAINPEGTTFWDVEDATYIGALNDPGKIGGLLEPIVPAPSGQFLSAAYHMETGNRQRVLYGIHRDEQTHRPIPRVEKTYENDSDAPTAPGIAFAPNEYAVGLDGDRVEIHSATDHSLLWEFETKGNIAAHLMNYSNDGRFLAVPTYEAHRQAVELWSISKRAGIRFTLEEKPFHQSIANVSFSPDGSWLSLTVLSFVDGMDQMPKMDAYAIDVFRQMAKLKVTD